MSNVFREWSRRWFCVMNSAEPIPIPTLEELIDETWQPGDLSKLVQYLRTAPVVLCTSSDLQYCKLCGDPLVEIATMRWDNKWLWPQSDSHYVEKHFIRLPDEMVCDIRNRNYAPPTIAECDYNKAKAVLSDFEVFVNGLP